MAMVELKPGDEFANFRIVRKLSEGGMGAIYVVTQGATGRKRALKLMHPETVSNAALREKFIQEARIGARVESEHVIDVVDAGVDAETGVPWLAMELLEGEDLGAFLARRTRLEPGEVAAIFEQLCHAVGAAHAAGIVHRDLKPDNLFLASAKRTGDGFTLKVLDFGIAKVVEESRTSANTGALGTPFWMAPEQTDRRAQITTSTDVWALGLIAYRLLTGKGFWLASYDMAGSLPMFLRELVLDPIPLASERSREQGTEGALPPGFDAWFARCVVRDQAARFPDGRAAYAGFAAMLGGRPSLSPSHAISAANVVVRTDPTHPGTDPTTGLGSARTMEDPLSLPLPHVSDEPHILPTHGGGRVWAALGVVLAGSAVAAILGLRGGRATPLRPAEITTPAEVVSENRCPKTMVPIAAGAFAMGSDDGAAHQKPIHKVSVDAFCIDMTEVLVSEYAECVASKHCAAAAKKVTWSSITAEDEQRWSPACNASAADASDHPVNCVSWDEADAYCTWAQKRLPTEAEWEYAARGSAGRIYPWGNEAPAKDRVNACGEECAHGGRFGDPTGIPLYEGSDGWEATAPARSFGHGKTPDGVYDLAGNVREWTATPYCKYGEPQCTSKWQVTRGGAWNSDAREGVKAALRDKSARDVRIPDLGFRCAR